MGKRKYWRKIHDDFFQSKEVKKMLTMEHGERYVIIYLKMLLATLNTEDTLIYNGLTDTVEGEVAMQLDELEGDVQKVMSILELTGKLVKTSDTEYMFTDVETGSESESAERVRRYRERKALAGVDRKRTDKIISMYNSICKSLTRCTDTDRRAIAINRLFGEGFTEEMFKQVFRNVEKNDFLKGNNNSGWSANIDWLLTGDNARKVYEGQYKSKPKTGFSNFSSEREYNEAELEKALQKKGSMR